MADTIAMNAADFIITSTYQEIAGRLENEPYLHSCYYNMVNRLLYKYIEFHYIICVQYNVAAKRDLDSMKAMLHLHYQGCVGLFQA